LPPQGDRRSEGPAAQGDGSVIQRLGPAHGRRYVAHFTFSVVVVPGRRTDAAEIESQHNKAGCKGVFLDLVKDRSSHRATLLRVGMAQNKRAYRIPRYLENRLEPDSVVRFDRICLHNVVNQIAVDARMIMPAARDARMR